MAYLAFQEIGHAGTGSSSLTGVAAAPVRDAVGARAAAERRLTALEWSVVALARRDRLGTVRIPGTWTRLARRLLRQRNPRLADGRLEALRRMAVLAWHDGYGVPSHEVRAFLAAGFTPGQYETVSDYIGRARQPAPRTVVSA